jgi:hypothetical protein
VSLSTTTKVESAGTAIVDAIMIGDPPDFVIATEASAELVPSMLATKMLLILNTLPDDEPLARISVVNVVLNAACTDLAVIVATLTRFGAAIVYSLLSLFLTEN